MKILLSSIILITTLCAQEPIEREIAKAAAIENSVERLAEFDAIAVRHKLTPSSRIATVTKGNWQIMTNTSPLDDTQTIVGMLDANEEIKIKFEAERPTLVVRYKEGELQVYVAFSTFIGSDETDVTTRFDKNAPTTEEWSISSSHESIFAPGDQKDLVKKLQSTDALIVRVTPYGESPVTISFTTTGIETLLEAIKLATTKK